MLYLLRRVAGIVPVLLLTWTLVFAVFQLIPGDPVNLILAGTPASQQVRDNERVKLGLDQPILQRYLTFLGHIAVGNLGDSYATGQPVGQMIRDEIGPTLQLAAGGLVFGISFGLLLGIIGGSKPNSVRDTISMMLALVGVSLPNFWIGMVLIWVFGNVLGWVPIVGGGPAALILPSVTVGLFIVGSFARLVRASMIEALNQDYVRTARAKGLSRPRIILKHVLRNALIPPITLLGVQAAILIGGAVVVENIFARPGIGTLLVGGVLNKDLPLVQAIIVYTTSAYIVINLCVDLLYGLIDPRIRTGAAAA
jgi:ABC-type dipeptide/oligopeptide/nickel transport system permease component